MYDAPQYKIYLIPDYKPDQGAIVFKMHHNMSDGLGIATLFQCYNGNYDSSALPAMKAIPFLKRFFIGLISPLLVIWTLLSIQLLPSENNALNRDEPITGKKTFGYLPDLDLARMKAYCKNNGCTINDYCAAMFSWSLQDYFTRVAERQRQEKSKVYEVPKTVRMALPFSFRQPFKTLADVQMRNDFGCLLLDLKLCSGFDESLKDCASVFGKLKTSLMPFGVLYSVKIPHLLPFGIPKALLRGLTDKFSIIYTNLNASTESYSFDGKKDLMHYFLVPGNGKVSTGFSLCTIGKRMSLGVFSDEVYMTNP